MQDLQNWHSNKIKKYSNKIEEYEIPFTIEQNNKNPRKLTPREASRLQGFPKDFKIVVSDTQAYKQFGNSVCVPVIQFLAEKIKESFYRKQH